MSRERCQRCGTYQERAKLCARRGSAFTCIDTRACAEREFDDPVDDLELVELPRVSRFTRRVHIGPKTEQRADEKEFAGDD